MGWWGPSREEEASAAEVTERLRWLVRLRWLAVPLFVAFSIAGDLLLSRSGVPWAALIVSNGVYGLLFSRRDPVPWLLGWARFEAYAIVALPVVLALLEHDFDT